MNDQNNADVIMNEVWQKLSLFCFVCFMSEAIRN